MVEYVLRLTVYQNWEEGDIAMKHRDFFIQLTGWIILLLIIISPAILSAKTIWGAGKTVTIRKDFEDFDKVDISSAFKASIHQGEEYNVTLRVGENIRDDVIVEKKGRTLEIGLQNHRSHCDGPLEVEITMPDIQGVELSGASSAVLEGFSFKHDLALNLSGASQVEGLIETGNLKLNLSGASKVTMNGCGNNLLIHASGASKVRMADFSCNDASLHLSGASHCLVYIDGELDVSASGSSHVKYRGKGRIGSVESSGFSRVSRM